MELLEKVKNITCWIFWTRILQDWLFFHNQKAWASTAWRIIVEKIQTWGIKIFVYNDTDKLSWNHIITFLLRRHFLLNKWPVSEIQFTKWNALNIQWFSLWEISPKTWYYLYLPTIIKCYFVAHMKTSSFMKWLTFLFTNLEFMKF